MIGVCARKPEIPSYPGQSYSPASAFHWNISIELSMLPMLCTVFQLASSKLGFSHPSAALDELFHCLSLINSGSPVTPCAAGTIFTTSTCPNVCCRTIALFANPLTPRPRTASIAIVFAPGFRNFATLVAYTCMPSGDVTSLCTASASCPFSHTFMLRGPAVYSIASFGTALTVNRRRK